MNARELHDATLDLLEKGVDRLCYGTDERQIVLRALDLLARTEESTDELVRELRNVCTETTEDYDVVLRAAAAIVALKAERDALKAHAEAMADAISGPEHTLAVKAYRRDFPKDAP